MAEDLLSTIKIPFTAAIIGKSVRPKGLACHRHVHGDDSLAEKGFTLLSIDYNSLG